MQDNLEILGPYVFGLNIGVKSTKLAEWPPGLPSLLPQLKQTVKKTHKSPEMSVACVCVCACRHKCPLH